MTPMRVLVGGRNFPFRRGVVSANCSAHPRIRNPALQQRIFIMYSRAYEYHPGFGAAEPAWTLRRSHKDRAIAALGGQSPALDSFRFPDSVTSIFKRISRYHTFHSSDRFY